MQYKLLLFDLDGTLLRNDKTISDKTLSEIMRCRRQGMLIGVSTSRSKKNSTAFTDKLCPNVLIFSGGAYVICDDKPVCIAEFSNDEVKEIADVVIGSNEEDGIAEFLSSYFAEDIDGALRNK